MPKFQPNETDSHSNFFLSFPQKPKKDFYGQELSQLDIFKRYGNLPDNNLLNNKLINILGKNLLRLEKQQHERNGNKLIPDAQKKEIDFYDELERESNAFTISLLDALSELEIKRLDSEDSLRIGNNLQKLKNGISALYQARLNRIAEQILELQPALGSENKLNTIKINRLQKLLKQVRENQIDIIKQLTNANKRLQSLYRNIMDDFAHEQRDLSVYQHTADRGLDYANQSLTEAYQDASYAMESHVFSVVKPTNKQLWKNLNNNYDKNSNIFIDSRDYPHMKKEDALLSASLIDKPVDDEVGKDSLQTAQDYVNQAKEASKKFKKNLPKAMKVSERTKQEEKTRTLPPHDTNIRISEILGQLNPIKNQPNSVLQGAIRLVNTGEIKLYQSSDLFSALGLACNNFGKYFEHQMASKHPAVTGAFFVAASAAFTAAGFGASGVHNMNAALHFMTKALTVNGKLGVSPEQLETGIRAISAEWLKLTHCEGLIETLIMDGFGLPKINYVLFDTIINGFEHKDLLHQFAQRIAEQDLEYYSGEEQAKKIAIQTAQVAMMLGLAIGLGMGFYKLAHLTTHGIMATGAKDIGACGDKIINVPPEVFKAVFGASSIPDECLAVVSALLTVKTAGMFLGKGMLVLNHMKQKSKITEDECDAMVLMCELRERYAINKDEYNAGINEDELNYYRFHLESLMAKDDKVEGLFGAAFLNAIKAKKPYISLAAKAGRSMKSFFIDGVWDKFLKPGGIVAGTILTFGAPLLWKTSRKPISNAFINMGLGMTRVIHMLGSALKTISIAAYGTIQRMCMATSDAVFNLISLINYGFQKGKSAFSNPVIATIAGIFLGIGVLSGGAAAKFGLATTSIGVKTLNFVGKIVKVLSTVAAAVIGAVCGVVATGMALLYVGVQKLRGKPVSVAGMVKSIWSRAGNFIKGPSNIASWISKNVTNPLISKIRAASSAIDREAQSVNGSPIIEQARDTVTTGIGSVFDKVKEAMGNVLYKTRNKTIRHAENIQQRLNVEMSETNNETMNTTLSHNTGAQNERIVFVGKNKDVKNKDVKNKDKNSSADKGIGSLNLLRLETRKHHH